MLIKNKKATSHRFILQHHLKKYFSVKYLSVFVLTEVQNKPDGIVCHK